MQPATIATVPGSSNVAKIFKGLTARWPSGLSQPNPRQEALATKATKATKASWMTSNATTNNHKTSSGQTFHWVESNTPKIQLDWQLLVSDQGKLELSTASHLNGVVLTCFKGHPKASVADSNLWFVTRNPVPSHIFKSWRIGGDIVGTDIEALTDKDCNEGSEDGVIADLSSSIINLDIDVMTETSKRTCPITILSSPESINSRQVYRKKHKDLNAKAQPAWPHQSEGPIFGPLEVNKVAAENDEDAPVPPNLWVSLFEQTSMLRDKEISDVDL
ncbi:hypothetical protein J3A83DRAFT_4428869 [Scleroderma citrinum]